MNYSKSGAGERDAREPYSTVSGPELKSKRGSSTP